MARPDQEAGEVRRVALKSVGSTNDEAMALALSGAAMPVWVTAERQERGRGRLGATWVSEDGNLYASHAFVGQYPPSAFMQLPIVAALAARDAIVAVLPERLQPQVRIKWPNDVLIDGRKVAGILAESRGTRDGRSAIVIGFGFNVAHHPAETRHPASDLSAFGVTVSAEDLFGALARSLADALAAWNEGSGFASLCARWNAHAERVNDTITVRLPRETLVGRFLGLDSSGQLRLLRHGREELISAGDVFFSSETGMAPHG
ncbi:biotin--[acetyl-CoA-carboxylase] ligase [Faunimonas sp. B44]|uniref:biotin--[acetyl-CoA-carboxylase] ligase n=1 Tax=Faunimonas sp. B44 TaxID=3461493 RepID=UPI004044DA69